MDAQEDEQHTQGKPNKNPDNSKANIDGTNRDNREDDARPSNEKVCQCQRLPWWRDSQWWQFIVAAVLVPFGIYAAIWVYPDQLDDMRKSTDAATKAARAAEAGVEQAREASYIDQRPWVTIKHVILSKAPGVYEPAIVKFTVENGGPTPALDVRGAASVYIGQGPSEYDSSTVTKKAVATVLGPNGDMSEVQIQMTDPAKSQDDIEQVKWKKKALYVAGVIVYCDVFHQKHVTKFCSLLDGPTIANEGAHFHVCEIGNRVDDEERQSCDTK